MSWKWFCAVNQASENAGTGIDAKGDHQRPLAPMRLGSGDGSMDCQPPGFSFTESRKETIADSPFARAQPVMGPRRASTTYATVVYRRTVSGNTRVTTRPTLVRVAAHGCGPQPGQRWLLHELRAWCLDGRRPIVIRTPPASAGTSTVSGHVRGVVYRRCCGRAARLGLLELMLARLVMAEVADVALDAARTRSILTSVSLGHQIYLGIE